MSLLYTHSVDKLLDIITRGIGSSHYKDISEILTALDQFQQDPDVLDKYLEGWIQKLIEQFFDDSVDIQVNVAKLFYTFARICNWKKIFIQLPSDIYLLPKVLQFLTDDDSNFNDGVWEVNYLLLSWLSILVMSPFKLSNDEEIFLISNKFMNKSQTLKPIVSHIHSELLIRNQSLYLKHYNQSTSDQNTSLNCLTLNNLLKLIITKSLNNFNYFDNVTIMNFTNRILNKETSSSIQIIDIKILTKLFKLNVFHENWDILDDIINFFSYNLSSSSTNIRFQLAHSFAKIIKIIIDDMRDTSMVSELLSFCQTESESLLLENWDLIDLDKLHTLLLMLAENSKYIVQNEKSICTTIFSNIVPHTSHFQQRRLNQIKGTQIRDASNFICWSFSRCPDLPKDVLQNGFLNLLLCSLSDPELVIRKSANAALQEILGRYGRNFLNDTIILRIIELKITDSQKSLINNTLILYDLLMESYPSYFEFIMVWLIKFNVFQNHDLRLLKDSITTVSIILDKYASNLSHICELILDLTSIIRTPIDAGKSLSLLLEVHKHLEISKLKQNIGISINILLKTNSIKKLNTSNEIFKQLALLKFWKYSLSNDETFVLSKQHIDLMLMIIRNVSMATPFLEDFKMIFKDIILLVKQEQGFVDKDLQDEFWKTMERFIHFNCPLACYLLSFFQPLYFTELFFKYISNMSPLNKSLLLESLNFTILDILEATGSRILDVIIEFLNDYTTSEQGDVGRFVRTSAITLIKSHQTIFWSPKFTNKTQLVDNVIRLIGEPLTSLRILTFEFLCEVYDHEFSKDANFNEEILLFQRRIFNNKNINFWKGYALSLGAIHSTDIQITSALDSFLKYYDSIEGESEKLELCNDLIRIIPTAKVLQDSKNNQLLNSATGIVAFDIIKFTVTCINMWIRLFESNIHIIPTFNYQGVYSKFYNIHLVNNNTLRLHVLKLFPFIAISQHSNVINGDLAFPNSIIQRFWQVGAKKENKLSKPIQTACIEGILLILISYNQLDKVNLLIEAKGDSDLLYDDNLLRDILITR
ncbi:hypothetical protein TBLA_0A04500 [Henningerozyma blattae CBS 6284]|uniref:Tubulin-folding cofactor D ARM repeats domain-containing protein n=1 Tax=Henningerozyma blattae (strain ATCC 34711 / CBS 6284 / DSM 70876 / NBRC 10599 / NRRL Y-10934 / UCD 77-7) TaxID=1071380 RepID=I2GVU2_HENB6|nr:hypothetical protein TBLA_0A04500 [Tetrapisispora blattae CBS 6284]CCH58244.1 hypothetical protein TBLA_0A04500 [Tetrapisispora blattae CBS 6284]